MACLALHSKSNHFFKTSKTQILYISLAILNNEKKCKIKENKTRQETIE